MSLWLATLARDHEFTFLDHALKSGDSLVGLTPAQIAAANWDEAKPGLPLFRQLVRDRVAEAETARAEIQSAPDDTARVIQEQRHRHVETRLAPVRIMGDAVLSAFFAADKAKAREKARADVESQISGMPPRWEQLEAAANRLRSGKLGIPPFHWQLEFPEVFARENGGYDAIVGNPPFAGKNTIIRGNAKSYLPWLQALHKGAHGNADLVAHFFRRAFGLLRQGGVCGLIATNTIRQGDTRASGLTAIIAEGGTISRATRRLKWPGEAAVVVSVVHIVKGKAASPVLDTRPVRRISAYLVEGDLDTSPQSLAANAGKAFQGSIVLGIGFTFDDAAAAKGESESVDMVQALIAKDQRNAERIFPYIGGDEVNNSPTHSHARYIIDFADFPRDREQTGSWSAWSSESRVKALREGSVTKDYPGGVAADWPDLLEIVRRRVKPVRDADKREVYRRKWWNYAERRAKLYPAIENLDRVIGVAMVSPHLAFTFLPTNIVYTTNLTIFPSSDAHFLCVLQSRIHEAWARTFSSTLEDRIKYSPADAFRTFPFPGDFESGTVLELAGDVYYAFRAQLLVRRNEGLTKTYNRFHSRSKNADDIARLRTLHHDMDVAVLRAYGPRTAPG
ncbi:MAG: DNA methyltransferase [Sphingomonas bacterium]